MVFIKSIRKQTLLAALLLFGCSVCADKANKMSIIDDQTNHIMVESFNFERLDSEDATTIKIETNKITKVSCSIFDKNNSFFNCLQRGCLLIILFIPEY